MADIKAKVQGLEASVQARDVQAMVNKTGNVYEALCVIAKRANQISQELKRELQDKLEDFASSTDSIEEVQENKEQIEISKFYERLPNSVLIASHEFTNDKIDYRYMNDNPDNF
jgi:DNA-directed RNA polymerase subunit K/omega